MDEAGPAQRPHLVLRRGRGAPPPRPRARRPPARARAQYGVLRSTKSRDRQQRRVDAARPTARRASAGSASITASHVATPSRPAKHGRRRSTSAQRAGSNWRPARAAARAPWPPRRRRSGGRPPTNSASWAIRAARGIVPRPRRSPGQPLPSHCSYAAPSASSTSLGQPELGGQRARHLRVVVDHVVDLAAAGDGELEPDPEALQRRRAGADQPQHRERAAQPRSSWSYLPALSAMSSPNHFACSCASV